MKTSGLFMAPSCGVDYPYGQHDISFFLGLDETQVRNGNMGILDSQGKRENDRTGLAGIPAHLALTHSLPVSFMSAYWPVFTNWLIGGGEWEMV